MTDAARRRAEACFAVARSATIAGERDAAVNRGTAIAEAAGLSLDLFDVPGRTRRSVPKPPPSRYVDDLFARPRSPQWGTIVTDDLLAEMADLFRRASSFDEFNAATAAEEVRAEMDRRAKDRRS